jgi:hypothetical protein
MTQNKSGQIVPMHLSSEELLSFHRHLIPDDESKRISLHLGECELCSDALKGISEMNDAKNIYNITHDLRKRLTKRRLARRAIFSRFDLITLLLLFFVLGLILFMGFYFVMLKR